jgi:hypothetical protein
MGVNLKNACWLLVVTLVLMAGSAVSVYGQDTVSTADVQFSSATPNTVKPDVVHKAGPVKQGIAQKKLLSETKTAAKAETQKSLWAIFIAGLIGGLPLC